MTLKQIFIRNLKEFRKREGFSQMKLAEYCDTAPSYIGDIEIGRRFPSMELIEKMADILRIEPYQFFKDQADNSLNPDTESLFPLFPINRYFCYNRTRLLQKFKFEDRRFSCNILPRRKWISSSTPKRLPLGWGGFF
jgi:transcriptional regulator with XRE-family HTH domain